MLPINDILNTITICLMTKTIYLDANLGLNRMHHFVLTWHVKKKTI